jgi:general secretion pathway protein N
MRGRSTLTAGDSRAERTPAFWAFGGVVLGVLLALALFAPARWAAAAVAQATQGRLQLADARGTVWNGSAQLLLTGGSGSVDTVALPTPLTWRARPRWDGLRLQLRSDCCTPQPITMRVRPGFGRTAVDVEDGRSQFSAGLLAGLGTPWNTLQFTGDLLLSSQSLSLEWSEGRLAVAGTAELQARDIASRLSTLRPLGTYKMTLRGGTVPALQLETQGGPLQLAGSGQWVGSRLRFNGTASAAAGQEEALSNLLNIIGRRNGAQSAISIG